MDEATDKISAADWDDDRTTSTRHDDSYIAAESTDDYDENTEQIRAEIEDTRAELSQTINEIQERLSPENVMDQVKEKVREATVGKVERVMDKVGETVGEVTQPAREMIGRAGTTLKESGRSAADAVWRNPIPVALIGLGVGLLMMRRYRGGNGYDYDEMSRTSSRTKRNSLMDDTDYETGEYELGKTRHTRTGPGTFSNMKETASDLAHRSTETLTELGSKARSTASSLGNRFGQTLRENPLAVGAVAIAAGTAVGLVLPTTKFENEYIGETSEKFVDKAQEVAREAIDKVQNVAQQQMGSEQQPGK